MLVDRALTNAHDAGITARGVIGHDSSQWGEFVSLQCVLTGYDHNSGTIRHALWEEPKHTAKMTTVALLSNIICLYK